MRPLRVANEGCLVERHLPTQGAPAICSNHHYRAHALCHIAVGRTRLRGSLFRRLRALMRQGR